MINSSTLATSPPSNGAKQRYRRITIGSIGFIFIVGISLGLYFIFSNANGAIEVETKGTQEQIRNGEAKLTLGDYEICNWKPVDFDTHIPLTIDGKDEGFFDVEDDMLVRGFLCGTDEEVLLAVDEQGLHGSILDSDNVVKVTAIDDVSSILTVSDQDLPTFTQSEKTEEVANKWQKYISSRQVDRRAMNALEPGSVDIHLHLDIDSHMVETYGSAFAAARYGVELIAVVNRDAYIDLGFNLKVVSINVRSEYLSQTSSTSAYLTELEKIPRPVNVNLLHSLSTRDLGGGIAYLGGLYSYFTCYGVSEVYGDFHTWDRYVVAHELGHNFGADHTHEMVPQVDTCGTSCPANPIGTIMSYCHLCSGGLSNLRMEWHERVREVILNDYALENHNLATRFSCQNFPQYPDVGVPFSLQGDECLKIDTSECTECSTETCTIDSVYQFTGTEVKAFQDPSFCWTASDNCDSISLQTCDDSTNQRFSFEDNSLKSESCGQVKHAAEFAVFEGTSVVSTWCSPDETINPLPSCDPTIIPLSCGQTHIGSTTNDCEGQRRFTFVAPDTRVSVSTCGSSFDTVLSVENEDARLYFSDDDGNCNPHDRAELLNMNLDQGEEYTIVLAGYGSETGNYDISITCSNDGPDPETTLAPTDPVPCDSTTVELECGIAETGSTVNSCDGEQRFVFTATTSMKTISTCGSNYDTVISIYDSNNALLASNDDNSECGLTSLIDDLALDIGSEYTVILAGYSSQVGEYQIELTCQSDESSIPSFGPTTGAPTLIPGSALPTPYPTKIPGSALPTQSPTEVPGSAYETQNPTVVPGSYETQSPTVVPGSVLPTGIPTTGSPSGCDSSIIQLECGALETGSTVNSCEGVQTFTFTASTNLKTISTCGSGYDTMVSIYNSENELVRNQDDSDECGLQSFIEDLPLTIGAEYTVVLSGFNSQVGSYNVELTCEEGTAPPTSTFVPCEEQVTDIACGDVLTGNTADSCDGEEHFVFTATTSMKTISACDSMFDTMLTIYNANGEEIAHQDDSAECGLQSLLEDVSLTIGAEYLVVLSGYGSREGAYTIELMCQSDDATLDPTNDSGSSAGPTIAPTSSAPTQHPTIVPTTSAPTVDPTTSTPTLDPSTSTPTNVPTTSTPTAHPTTLAPTADPTVDPTLGCDDSMTIAMACGETLSGSTIGTCDGEQRFVFTASTNLKTISACGSEYDTMLTLYDSNNVEIAYQDDNHSDGCGLQSVLEGISVDIGAEYTVVLSGYGSQVGNYNMELVCDVPELSPAPTAVPATGCDSSVIDISCGESLTGSTVGNCDGQQRFTFTATTDMKTISTCGSEYDTMLTILNGDGQEIFHQDDSNECDIQSFIRDLAVEIGSQYTIVLSGYANRVGTYNLELTCGAGPSCDDSIQTLTCGDIVTQSTINACQGEQKFQFIATSGLTTMSTCGSEFDTTLKVESDNGFSRYVDDSDECGYHSVISDMALEENETYFVTLSGYSGRRGNYRLEVTCGNDPIPTTDAPTEALQVTYTTVEGGKCLTLGGADPLHEFYRNEPNCEQLCTERTDCYGYSMSRSSNCLLWTQSDIMGGGARWGGASCHMKDN